MRSSLIDRLLLSEEGLCLDFKRDQYEFANANDYVKSELLKDILAFANTPRSSPAYIVIGVLDVPGRRGRTVGVATHLDDAALQQFVNSKTQRPMDFSYRATAHNQVDIGIIEIPVQERPIYANKKYGKVEPMTVYIRRGSSTGVATPDEIAIMGRDLPHAVLSRPLLRSLSQNSLSLYRPPGDPREWVPRALDRDLSHGILRDVTFLVAHSGVGKTVACYKNLQSHIANGGFGFIVNQDIIASELTLKRVLGAAIRQLYPALPPVHESPLSLCAPEKPLLIVVEDINRSGDRARLVETIARWSRSWSNEEQRSALSSWRVLCPAWPETIESLRDDVRRRVLPMIANTARLYRDGGSHRGSRSCRSP